MYSFRGSQQRGVSKEGALKQFSETAASSLEDPHLQDSELVEGGIEEVLVLATISGGFPSGRGTRGGGTKS